MADFSITDSLGNPVVAKPSGSLASLNTYLKTEVLHLVVAPDFIAHKDQALTTVASPKPVTFQLSVGHDFQLGDATPEVDVHPTAQAVLSVNATAGSDLFDDDAFHTTSTVANLMAYVGLSVTGTLDLGVSGSAGNLTFGIEHNGSITFDHWKAFPTGANPPALGAATAATVSGFVIPASMDDLLRLGAGDVCSVSGQGSLTVSGGIGVSLPVNPLASVNLPAGLGTLTVQDGAMAGLSASFTLTGSYQIRLEKLVTGPIRLSYLKEKGTSFEVDVSGSAGVSAIRTNKDLLAQLMGAIEKGTPDPKLLDALSDDDRTEFNAAIKAGLDHSLQASVTLALSTGDDNQAAFQYEIRPELLNAQSSQAVARALKGDLSLLTSLEEGMQSDGALAPGVKLLNSVFSTARNKGTSLKINLLGIVNLISISKLMNNCEFLFEPTSGELTIKETAQSEKISAITDPLNKQEALRKALFYSVLATTTYVAGKAVTMPVFNCQAVHFAMNQNTNQQTVADYTNWFVALNLITANERAGIVTSFSSGGPSSCTMRAQFDNVRSESLFFDAQSNPRPRGDYLEIGRRAMKALLDPTRSDIDRIRYRFLDNSATWAQALAIGPSPQLSTLLPLSSSDPAFNIVLADVSGDLFDIVWWADAMQKTGQALQQMRAFLAGRDPATLANDPAFADRRNSLQKLMVGVVGESKLHFHEPWGMVCLYWAAGSRGSSGVLTAKGLSLQKSAAAGAGV